MQAKKTPIKGFSRYSTDGAKVYLRSRPIRIEGDIVRLIPDKGDGVNLVEVKVEYALSAGAKDDQEQRKEGSKTTRKRNKKAGSGPARLNAKMGKQNSK